MSIYVRVIAGRGIIGTTCVSASEIQISSLRMSAEFFACKTTAEVNDHNGDEAAHFLANISNSCAHCPHFATTFFKPQHVFQRTAAWGKPFLLPNAGTWLQRSALDLKSRNTTGLAAQNLKNQQLNKSASYYWSPFPPKWYQNSAFLRLKGTRSSFLSTCHSAYVSTCHWLSPIAAICSPPEQNHVQHCV